MLARRCGVRRIQGGLDKKRSYQALQQDADRWPPPGSLVIADLAQQTRDEHLKLTLLDSGSTRWPPGPSARLLTLLESDLPWTISLTDRAGHSAQPAPAATRP